jgi:porphobilinogen deaminase
MARSGLERIGMTSRIAHDFSVREMLPAVGQGIVAVECVENDWLTRGRLAKIEDAASRRCADAEREVLWVLNGHCNSPIAGHATLDGNEMMLTAAVLDEAGDRFIEVSRRARRTGRANSAAPSALSCSTRAPPRSSRAQGPTGIRYFRKRAFAISFTGRQRHAVIGRKHRI